MCGGGLAGAAAAIRLAGAGRRVLLLEREPHPTHKVCGEFLSGPALAELQALGLDPASLGASPVRHIRLHHRARAAAAALPFPAAGLSRFVLDEALLRHAASLGAEIRRGVRVRAIADGGVTTDAGDIAASTVLLATGKHDLRGHARPSPAHEVIGLKMHYRLAPSQAAALAGAVEVTLFDGGYAGLQPIEAGLANLCLVVAANRFTDWPTLLARLDAEAPGLRARLAGATPSWERPVAIARIPYGFVHPGDGEVFRLGDQAAVIPSFCGDGMAIALHSGRLATESILSGADASTYGRTMARTATPPIRLATRLDRLSRRPALRSLALRTAQLAPAILPFLARRTRLSSSLA